MRLDEEILELWTSMGKKFAPSYADLFLAVWEEKSLEKCGLKALA